MEDENGASPDLQRATEGLEEGLETCQKILADYRSLLLSLNHQDNAQDGENPEA